MTTFVAKPASVKQDWFVIDATNLTLGRLAVEVAKRLRGKHKPEYTPHVDVGDHIVILNANKVNVTGRKRQGKIYYWHTGYPGGIKSATFDEMIDRNPIKVITRAVKGMLPKNKLGKQMLSKLKVYVGTDHPHTAQQPQSLELKV